SRLRRRLLRRRAQRVGSRNTGRGSLRCSENHEDVRRGKRTLRSVLIQVRFCRAAEQRDERAPPYVWHALSSLPFWREPMSYFTSRSACRRAVGEPLGRPESF